jgi:hypothetical protein
MRATVLLADDHKMFTEGLQRLIAPQYAVIGAVWLAVQAPAATSSAA